jgi:hypothetical protein
LRRGSFIEWCKKNDAPATLSDPIRKPPQNIPGYSSAYDFAEAHRTSNMIDRLMQRMDRHLLTTQYFHGALQAAELSIRGWALIQTFAPWKPRTIKIHADIRVHLKASINFDIMKIGCKTY